MFAPRPLALRVRHCRGCSIRFTAVLLQAGQRSVEQTRRVQTVDGRGAKASSSREDHLLIENGERQAALLHGEAGKTARAQTLTENSKTSGARRCSGVLGRRAF